MNSDIENVADPASPDKSPKRKKPKKEKVESEPDSSEVELGMASEDAPDAEEIPERTKKLFWAKKYADFICNFFAKICSFFAKICNFFKNLQLFCGCLCKNMKTCLKRSH